MAFWVFRDSYMEIQNFLDIMFSFQGWKWMHKSFNLET